MSQLTKCIKNGLIVVKSKTLKIRMQSFAPVYKPMRLKSKIFKVGDVHIKNCIYF